MPGASASPVREACDAFPRWFGASPFVLGFTFFDVGSAHGPPHAAHMSRRLLILTVVALAICAPAASASDGTAVVDGTAPRCRRRRRRR